MISDGENFSPAVLQAFADAEQINIQFGHNRQQHRPLGIWAVVVEDQVYIRSWTGNPQGWYRIIQAEPVVTVEVGEFTLEGRAVSITQPALNEAINQAYHTKYAAAWPTYATDMIQPGPVSTTMQLLPAK